MLQVLLEDLCACFVWIMVQPELIASRNCMRCAEAELTHSPTHSLTHSPKLAGSSMATTWSAAHMQRLISLSLSLSLTHTHTHTHTLSHTHIDLYGRELVGNRSS